LLELDVYNTDNIERVRRDEEIAQKKEEEEEMKMQQEDAERRMVELRKRAAMRQGGTAPSAGGGEGGVDKGSVSEGSAMGLSRANLTGGNKVEEGDALYATGAAHRIGSMAVTLHMQEHGGYREDSFIDPQVHKLLTDKSGHINLFNENPSGPRRLSNREKNPEHEKEMAEKEVKIAEQFSMALGKPAGELRPWYVNVDKVGEKQEKKTEKQIEIEKRRDERFKNQNDPMAVMRRGVRQLKEVEVARKRIEGERKYELEGLKIEQEELAGFCLNGLPEAQDHSSRPQLDSSRNGRLGKDGGSRNYGSGKYKHRRRGRSKSPESSSDTARDRKRRHKERRNSRGRDHRSRERSWGRSWDRDPNNESGYKHCRSSGRDRRDRVQGRDRRSGWTEGSDQRLKGKEGGLRRGEAGA